jgi:pimeloyl-ACP methyl ester carboxylesterase
VNIFANWNYNINQTMTQNLFTAQDVYCRIDHLKIHYQVCGDVRNPPLVLIHGIGGHVNWWKHNLQAYAAHFRVYALDLPGFGYSQPYLTGLSFVKGMRFLEQWLDFVGLKQPNIIAHSLGGQITAHFAALHPEKIEKLILVAPSGMRMTVRQYLGWIRTAPKIKVPLAQATAVAFGTMRSDVVTVTSGLFWIFQDKVLPESYTKITTPTLLLWGNGDTIVPPVLASKVQDIMHHAPVSLEIIAGGTHDVMWDQPEEFNRITLNYLLQ